MFETLIDTSNNSKKSEQKEAAFPTSKAAKYLNETLIKYAQAGDIDAIKEVIARILTEAYKQIDSSKKIQIPRDIGNYLTKLQQATDDANAQLLFYCYKIHSLIEMNDCSQASQLRAEAIEKFPKNTEFLELINRTYANAVYKLALRFSSSFNKAYYFLNKEKTKEAVASMLAAILVNKHPEAAQKLREEIKAISYVAIHSDSVTKREDRLKIKAHFNDMDPRAALVAIVYYILDKTWEKDLKDLKETCNSFLNSQKLTTVKSPTAEDYLKGTLDPFVVFNFSKYCYNQGFINGKLHLEILEKVTEASKENIIPALADKFFIEQVRILVQEKMAEQFAKFVDNSYGTDGIMALLMNISAENEWNTFVQKSQIINLYASIKKDFLKQWSDDTKPNSKKEGLKAAINTIKDQLPVPNNKIKLYTTFANTELTSIAKVIEKELTDEKKWDEIKSICSNWQPKSEDQTQQKAAIAKIVDEANEYLSSSANVDSSKLEVVCK